MKKKSPSASTKTEKKRHEKKLFMTTSSFFPRRRWSNKNNNYKYNINNNRMLERIFCELWMTSECQMNEKCNNNAFDDLIRTAYSLQYETLKWTTFLPKIRHSYSHSQGLFRVEPIITIWNHDLVITIMKIWRASKSDQQGLPSLILLEVVSLWT